jgi:putative ABC transport system permease protein
LPTSSRFRDELGLAAVGIYAVTAHAVAQRTPEIGVRIALGAQPWHLMWMTLKGAVFQLGLGLLLGVVCVFAWDKAFYTAGPTTSQLGGLKMSNAIGLMSAAGMLALIAAVACLVPVVRAMRVNPAVVLRYE